MKAAIENIGIQISIMADEVMEFFRPSPEVKAQYQENREAIKASRLQLIDTKKKASNALFMQSVVHGAERQQLREKQAREKEELKVKVNDQVNLAKVHLTETKAHANDKLAQVKSALRRQYLRGDTELVTA
jgi:queuine/archaeosine tRNA-ribosyltransferase